MSPWHLLWIVPVVFSAGMVISTLLSAAACSDCMYALRYQSSLAEAKSFEDGFAQGLAELDKVG